MPLSPASASSNMPGGIRYQVSEDPNIYRQITVNQPRIIQNLFNLFDMMYETAKSTWGLLLHVPVVWIYMVMHCESRSGYHFPSCHIAGFPEKMVQKRLTIAELLDLSRAKWVRIDHFKWLSWQLHEQYSFIGSCHDWQLAVPLDSTHETISNLLTQIHVLDIKSKGPISNQSES